MTKSMFKRAWLSISRKLSKTIVLAIVMFVMANLVLASITIKNAVNESTKFAKQSLGSTVYLTADMDKVREEAMQNAQENSNGTFKRMKLERPEIKLDMVKSIAASDYIKDFTYGINANAKEGNFTAIDNGISQGPTISIGGRNPLNLFGNITIIGINSYAFINEVQNKTMELIDGTYFDEKTTDSVIISNELAQENDLEVGDKITLINEEIDIDNYDPRYDEEPKVTSSKTYEMEIIGIYDVNTDNFNGNNIYMNVETAAKLLKADKYNAGNYGVDNISYFLNDPDDAEAFIKEASDKFPNMSDDKLMLDINSDAYEQMTGPIEQVGSFADTVLWIVVIASVLIISLIINNNIKDRKYEMGVLMSLGGTKMNIIGQFLIELIIIGTIGFAVSIGSSYFLANRMGTSMLEKQIRLAEEQSQNNYGRPGGMGNAMIVGGLKGGINNIKVDTIDSIDINVGITDYVMLFLIGYLIVSVALVIPSVNIVKYEPKTILTGGQ